MHLFLLIALSCISVFGYSQLYVQKQKAIEDILFYNKLLEEVHYNPYLYINKGEYLRKTDSIINGIGDSIEIKKYILKLYSLTALLQDGHAHPTIPSLLRPELAKNQFLPLSLFSDDKHKLFVWNSASKESIIAKGSQIVSINGVVMLGLFNKAINYSGGLFHYRKEIAEKLFGYFLFLNGISAPFNISYLQGGKLKKAVVKEGVDFRTSLSLSMPNANGAAYTFSIKNNKVGYLDFVSMSGDHRQFAKYLDSCFSQMASKKIKTFVVDLRKNTGGNSILGELLLSYITNKQFSMMGGRYWKISQHYKDYLRHGGDTSSQYLQQANGSIWQLGSCGAREQRFRVDSIFKGVVYIITGPFTYSSANMLADAVKQFRLATLIGQPTGESTNDFGEVYNVELPNTKLKVQVTTSFDIGADCKKDHRLPVIPDVLLKTTAGHKINGFDPVMEYIYKHSK